MVRSVGCSWSSKQGMLLMWLPQILKLHIKIMSQDRYRLCSHPLLSEANWHLFGLTHITHQHKLGFGVKKTTVDIYKERSDMM